jgi:hypothetical protein
VTSDEVAFYFTVYHPCPELPGRINVRQEGSRYTLSVASGLDFDKAVCGMQKYALQVAQEAGLVYSALADIEPEARRISLPNTGLVKKVLESFQSPRREVNYIT